jgi:microcystin-dependent protein
MSIETATYISDLSTANPPSTDPVGQAASHLRLLKSTLKNTFPSVTGAVTRSHIDLSYGLVPTGGIIFWSALQGAVPSGYGSCTGATYDKVDGSGTLTTPDLRDKFLAIAGTLRPVDTTGGSASVTPALTVDGHVLTVAELPIHTHTVSDPSHTHGITDPGHSHYNAFTNAAAAGAAAQAIQPYPSAGAYTGMTQYTGVTNQYSGTGITVQNTGTDAAHSHTGSVTAVSIVPVYYSLIAIMRL